MGLVGTVSALGLPAPALAQSPAPAPATPPVDSPEASAEARALAEVVRLRYERDLTSAQLGAIARDLDTRLEGGRELRQLRLTNDQEPEFTFRA
jgi:hypothetical protein